MIIPIISGIIQPVFAANIAIKVYIDSYDSSSATVNLHWDQVQNVESGVIEYHVPSGAGFDTVKVPIDKTKNTATIDKIKNDLIYDFKIILTDSSSQTFIGQQFFLPQVSFYAEQVDQQPISIVGGGVETGVYPTIKLTWNMPKVFNNAKGSMEYASEALAQINGSIRKLNFTFNIAADKSLANVVVKMDPNNSDPDQQYTAVVSGDTDSARFSKVKFDDATGKLSFYIMGVKDDKTLVPSMTDIRLNNKDQVTGLYTLPQQITTANDNWYVLPHLEIRPGTIYKMSINTLFVDSEDKYIGSVAEGLSQNPLLGATDYTYTPIRFQLTKDTYDNIYVRINRINQGGVTMPRLYYEVQTSNVPSDQDTSWTTRKKLDDTYFNGEYAITVVTGINSKNTVYYRIIVKSDGVTDKIQSLKLPYIMQDDSAKPPVPKEIVVSKVDLAMPSAASGITDKSSNITITWDKPSNWDQIKNHLNKDVYFHFLLSVSEKDLDTSKLQMLEANGKEYGLFPVKYRLAKYVSANSPNIKDTGTKLVYTINGFDLFKGEDELGNLLTIQNTENYPNYLLPNKTYYMQMYTTLAADRGVVNDSLRMSEKSLTKSFTTLSPTGRDVAIPKYFEWVKTTVNPGSKTAAADATIEIRFDDLKINWDNYTTNHHADDSVVYDLYMSTRTDPDSFGDNPIGTTEVLGDVEFSKQTLGDITWVNATINKFTDIKNVSRFGKSLSPNTTYYFMVKVRLKMVNETPQYKESVETVLLPVTTPRGEATIPDNTAKRPVAPTDFAIAVDKNGDPMITGQTVTFEWTAQEDAAAYNLIATSIKVEADTPDDDSSIVQDSIYKSFKSVFGNKDNNIDGDVNKLTIDPKMAPVNFTYNSQTKKCRYTIDTWLYPNKIYYFSLRSEITNSNNESVWVSIPVTTSLIESPTMLQVVNDCELAFYWDDTTRDMTAENYNIMLKAAGETDYTLLSKSQYKIVKDDSIYYARTTPNAKLKPNTQYSLKIVRTTDNKVLSTLTMYTRNDYYEIDIKWQGYAIDPFSGFEIAIRTEDDSDYTVLNNQEDLEQYFHFTQTTYPYYIEKSNSNQNNNYYTYNTRIKLAEITLPNGTKQHRQLTPNTKYYIKVRAVKKDSSNSAAVTPSKYVGPVDTRTEFNQDDYDENENNTNVSAKFLDMIDKLEQDVFWDVNKKNGVTNKILVKDDKLINLLEGYGYFSCTIDVSQSPGYISSDEIYLAKDILKAMKSNNKSVIIKAKDIEYTIRPETFNVDGLEEFKSAKAVLGSKDVYLKISNTQSASMTLNTPTNTTASSKVNILSAQVVASKQTSASINALIKDKLYNDKTGIIQKKLAVIKNPNNLKVKDDAQKVNQYLDQLFEEVKSEVSYYLEDTLNGVGYTAGILGGKYNISKFSSPLGVRMPYKASSISNPYVIYGDVGNWQKLTQNLKYEDGYLNYFVAGPGKYTIFSAKDVASTVSDDSSAKPYISKLSLSYDLTTVFPGIDTSFNPDLNVTVKEIVLLYELISEAQNDTQVDIKATAKEYGLDKIINTTNVYRNITRQEAAAIVIKLYTQKIGTDYDKLKASYSKTIKDDNNIAEKYAVPVYLCLQMNIMTLDSNANFNPKVTINRAGIVVVLQKMLEA